MLILKKGILGFLGTEFEASFATSIPSWFGIFVYKYLAFKVTRNVLCCSWMKSNLLSRKSILLMKSAVPYISDGSASTYSLR